MINSDVPIFPNWAESAAFWDKHRESRQAMFGPITEAMCREGGLPESPVVSPYVALDVAAGTGDVSIELAETLGNKATVWCTDMVPEMVKVAERTAAASGLNNVVCRESPAENLPFESAAFDAVLCRFGIMFFRDP